MGAATLGHMLTGWRCAYVMAAAGSREDEIARKRSSRSSSKNRCAAAGSPQACWESAPRREFRHCRQSPRVRVRTAKRAICSRAGIARGPLLHRLAVVTAMARHAVTIEIAETARPKLKQSAALRVTARRADCDRRRCLNQRWYRDRSRAPEGTVAVRETKGRKPGQ